MGSTYEERERARRARIGPLEREKIDRRLAEDAGVRTAAVAGTGRIREGRWYWACVAGETRPVRVLEKTDDSVLVGIARCLCPGGDELPWAGLTVWCDASFLGGLLTGEELSDRLRHEPVTRAWPVQPLIGPIQGVSVSRDS